MHLNLTTTEVLRHAVPFLLHSLFILESTYAMNTYVLLQFEHKNDVTIIIKLHRASRLRLVGPQKSLTMTVTYSYFQNVIGNGNSWIRVNFKANMGIYNSCHCHENLVNITAIVYDRFDSYSHLENQ